MTPATYLVAGFFLSFFCHGVSLVYAGACVAGELWYHAPPPGRRLNNNHKKIDK